MPFELFLNLFGIERHANILPYLFFPGLLEFLTSSGILFKTDYDMQWYFITFCVRIFKLSSINNINMAAF